MIVISGNPRKPTNSFGIKSLKLFCNYNSVSFIYKRVHVYKKQQKRAIKLHFLISCKRRSDMTFLAIVIEGPSVQGVTVPPPPVGKILPTTIHMWT